MERYQNMQELWMNHLNNTSEMLQATPSHARLQNFRNATGECNCVNRKGQLDISHLLGAMSIIF